MNPTEENRADLESRIAQATLARQLTENPGWTEFARPWLDDSLQTYDKELKSTAFVFDHEGYLNARSLYVSYQNFIEMIEGTIEDGDRARIELTKLDNPE